MNYDYLQKGGIVDSLKDGRKKGIIRMCNVYMSGTRYTVKWPDDGPMLTYDYNDLIPHMPDGNDILKGML